MGYVLPIEHYQFNDYQKRVIKDKQDPFYIEKPYKIIFNQRHRDFPNKGKHFQNSLPSNYNYRSIKKVKPQLDPIYADLTGIGSNFNERV